VSQKRYFITGTGTGVGKTFVTCELARLARERGLEVVAHKPIETGCPLVDGKRRGEDQTLLRLASSPWLQTVDDEPVTSGCYQFERPLAPSVAAAHEKIEIDLPWIERILARASVTPNGEPVDLFLVEGAGGWRVPISDRHEMRDLARIVALESSKRMVIVVANATLGTINHSLLTLEAIEGDGFLVAALVLSNRPGDPLGIVQSNVAEIRKRWAGRILTVDQLGQLL
jgi:dethiobiotin synthetase